MKYTLDELNVLIAEKILGHIVSRNKRGGWSLGEPEYHDEYGAMELQNPLPNYLYDIQAAWSVAERLASKGAAVRVSNKSQMNDYWWCYIEIYKDDQPISISQGNTISEAICLAAIQTVGVEVNLIGLM